MSSNTVEGRKGQITIPLNRLEPKPPGIPPNDETH
jgi:hypothetical protein